MSEPLRLSFIDVMREVKRKRSYKIVGRDFEFNKIVRSLNRKIAHNVLIVGESGIGKTALVEGMISQIAVGKFAGSPDVPYIRLDSQQLANIFRRQPDFSMVERVRAAFASLGEAVVWIDDGGAMLRECSREEWILNDILQPFFERSGLRLILSLNPDEYRDYIKDIPRIERNFEVILLSEPSLEACREMVKQRLKYFEKIYKLNIGKEIATTVTKLAQQLNTGRAMPDRALRLLDDSCAGCSVEGAKKLESRHVQRIFSERTGMTVSGNQSEEKNTMEELPNLLRKKVCGQKAATDAVAKIVQRGYLGLRNPNRPIGSFLFLGPSGVGKTECAKVLAENVYGKNGFVRLDMSEFGEPHTRQRLIGSPPGYVGHEEGGQLTNPIAQHPFSLILLDEIEKAHPTLFDVFLQVLDDGRLTDGKGTTVDFTKTIIIATSNIGTEEILRYAEAGVDVSSVSFVNKIVVQLLLKKFRPEFLNRFDAIVAFKPLDEKTLAEIARLEISKIEERFKEHNIAFKFSEEILNKVVQNFSNPKFGARPLKRFLEDKCEKIISEKLLANQK